MVSEHFVGWIARWLPSRSAALHQWGLWRLVQRLRRVYDNHEGDVPTVLHGFPARINAGNPYPFIVEQFPLFNRPLVELVRQMAAERRRRLTLIDVGAAIGDTVLLLQAEARDAIAAIHCVEPQPRFVALLRHNVERFAGVSIHVAMLARQSGTARSLVHNHAGTATATGSDSVPAVSLDDLLGREPAQFDVLKIDIDGSDGEALAGASALLRRDHPAVIFEWHPALLAQTGNDFRVAFDTLHAAGYTRLLWFNNVGTFSHFSTPQDPEIPLWFDHLRQMQPHGDPHFDIVALPPDLDRLASPLASLGALAPSTPQTV